MIRRTNRHRLSGETCAYCGGPAASYDHIFPRAYFPKRWHAGLPVVPACDDCNNKKSGTEGYLGAVLLFAGQHSDAREHMLANGPPRLKGNLALHRTLAQGSRPIWLEDNSGLIKPTMTVPFENDQLVRFFQYVVKGLVRFEFNEALGRDDFISIHTITSVAGEPIFRDKLAGRAAARANRNLGDGAIVYEGAQGIDNPHVTVWLITLFGGLLVPDRDGRAYETKIGAFSGPRSAAARAGRRVKWLEGHGAISE